jgi:hypothetical protein
MMKRTMADSIQARAIHQGWRAVESDSAGSWGKPNHWGGLRVVKHSRNEFEAASAVPPTIAEFAARSIKKKLPINHEFDRKARIELARERTI